MTCQRSALNSYGKLKTMTAKSFILKIMTLSVSSPYLTTFLFPSSWTFLLTVIYFVYYIMNTKCMETSSSDDTSTLFKFTTSDQVLLEFKVFHKICIAGQFHPHFFYLKLTSIVQKQPQGTFQIGLASKVPRFDSKRWRYKSYMCPEVKFRLL